LDINKSIEGRHSRLRQLLDDIGVDIAIISNSTSLFYFTGFNPMFHDHPMYLIIYKSDSPKLILNMVRKIHAKQDSWVKDLIIYGPSSDKTLVFSNDAEGALLKLLENTYVIGIEKDLILSDVYKILNNKKRKIENISKGINRLRSIKDEYEINCIKKAARLTDVGLKKAIETAKSRKDEIDICINAEYAMAEEWRSKFPEIDTASPVGGPEAAI
jgi:Xaa-Pro dipeptidase